MAPTLSGGFYPLPDPQMTHPDNTTVFIGGLPGSVGREELEAVFRPFGEVTYVSRGFFFDGRAFVRAGRWTLVCIEPKREYRDKMRRRGDKENKGNKLIL